MPAGRASWLYGVMQHALCNYGIVNDLCSVALLGRHAADTGLKCQGEAVLSLQSHR